MSIGFIRTAAEIAASVTPVDYTYAPGDVRRYGTNSTPGTSDMTTAINAAIACNTRVYAPAGTYLVTDSLLIRDYTELCGDGYGTVFNFTTDIEVIASANADANPLVSVYLHDFKIERPLGAVASPTKYQIHLRNPIISTIERVWTFSGLNDTPYSTTNVSGIWIEDTAPVLEGPYINRFIGNFIQNGGLLFSGGGTDSTIIDNFIYGHCTAHGLKFSSAGGGNFAIIGNNITSPPHAAGIEIVGGSQNQYRIIGNFFDGNPAALDSGYGILINSAPRVIISNNHIWAMGKAAIRAVDAAGLIVTSNIFQNCNDEDDSYSDVEIVSDAFQVSLVNVSDNYHLQETSRTNKGYAIREVNEGFNPVQCIYKGAVISANYQTTGSYGAIETLQSIADPQAAHVRLNSGGGSETEIRTSETLTLTGCTTSPTGVASITRNGNQFTITIPTITGASSSTAATLTGLRAGFRPAAPHFGVAVVTDNGVNEFGYFTVDSSGAISLYRANGTAIFTPSGTKGIFTGATLTYQLV